MHLRCRRVDLALFDLTSLASIALHRARSHVRMHHVDALALLRTALTHNYKKSVRNYQSELVHGCSCKKYQVSVIPTESSYL